ncbi:hypothetical protein [Sulfolobus acidocaldarius]|nr:hypothetical protein [Sulfolobus acidocaldarius]
MMDCNNIYKILIDLWVGDSKEAEDMAKECLSSLRGDVDKIRKNIKEIKQQVQADFLLPKALRDKGVSTEDILKISMYELARRAAIFSGPSKVKKNEILKYSLINMEEKLILKGTCERCKGYRYAELTNGFLVVMDDLIYAESRSKDEDRIVGEITKILYSLREK